MAPKPPKGNQKRKMTVFVKKIVLSW